LERSSIGAGEFVCLLGPNGAGKTTLLRTLAGMQPALAGDVEIEGRPLAILRGKARAQRLAVVLTERVGTGLLSARELVALGRQPYTGWGGRLRDEDHAAVDRALADVGSLEYASRLVSDLSDGERQRIWLARALAQEPRVLSCTSTRP
jgi:iron complex transport system ATP-binding protein